MDEKRKKRVSEKEKCKKKKHTQELFPICWTLNNESTTNRKQSMAENERIPQAQMKVK